MKKRIALLLSTFVSTFLFSQMDVAKAKWKAQPVKIDGFAKEWSKPMSFFDTETKLFFAFANDGSNLYICFQSNDERNQVKINRAGMKVFIRTKGKEKHNASIDFPLTDSKLNFASEEVNESEKPDIQNLKNTFLLQNTNMLTKGFATQNGTFPINDSTGIHLAMNWDEKNIMSYEICVPLKELFGTNYSPADLAKTITMVVEVNAITRLEEGTVDVAGTAMGSAAGQSGGMTRAMPGAGAKKEKRPLFDKNKFKQKFVLAKAA